MANRLENLIPLLENAPSGPKQRLKWRPHSTLASSGALHCVFSTQ